MKQQAQAVIVDDDGMICAMLGAILNGRGYQVRTYPDCGFCKAAAEAECACLLESACADLLVLDLNLAGKSGLEFAEGQKAAGCSVRNIALMSGRWTGEDMRRAHELGCHIIRKPFSLDDIHSWLNECEAARTG